MSSLANQQGNLTYWGEFFTVVGLGTPVQYVPLQVDTGSSDLIVYAKDCSGCNSTATYDPYSSNTARDIMCDDSDYNCYDPDMVRETDKKADLCRIATEPILALGKTSMCSCTLDLIPKIW